MNAPRRATHQRPPVRIRINRPNLTGLAVAIAAELVILGWMWALIPG